MHLESKFNLNAVGGQVTPLGLLQIHRGGLAPRDLTNEDLKNAETNIRIAINNMTRAYNRGLQKGLKGPDLLKHVTNTSGWTGNKGVQWAEKQTEFNQSTSSKCSLSTIM
ncbi:transglycosylase [Bacillus cereus]|nr:MULTISPECIES: transglycosylase SLT domain-containing protein [Bacillus cereus group]PDY15955.1 transglycosylase [Bacillus cereus]PET56702.1 transglycosylase [Bacillus cereus]PEU50188.1 transglycosylase [Bacillus cereus]PEX75087.1 transglycosylase [Bacillus cereus]PFA75534.1 transglycosylase [Bacillus cereus]